MDKKLGLLLAFLLGMGVATLAAQKATDSTVVDPDAHHVVLENEHVRVFEGRAAPGWKSPMHTHPPLVLVSLGSARLKMTLPDGTSSIFDLRPGQVLWVDGAQHSWELLAGDLHGVGVEVKSAAPAHTD
ncbi:MAG: cytoplasmic protein [Acidobacteriota bacterium]